MKREPLLYLRPAAGYEGELSGKQLNTTEKTHQDYFTWKKLPKGWQQKVGCVREEEPYQWVHFPNFYLVEEKISIGDS